MTDTPLDYATAGVDTAAGDRVVDFPLFYPLISLLPAHHMNTNIFVFISQTMNSARGRSVHFAN